MGLMSISTFWDVETSSGAIRSVLTTHTVPSPSSHTGATPKEGFVRRLFDTITPRYDLFNQVASLGLDRAWRHRTIRSLELVPGMRVLDLASGTGDLALEAVLKLVPLGKVIACDLSGPMLSCAVRKLARHPLAHWHVEFAQGRAEGLPFSDASFHAATIGFALRNVSDLSITFRELHRVVRPGGRIALLEFGRPKNRLLRLGHRIWLTAAVPLIGLLTTGKIWPFLYLRRSILSFMNPEEVADLLNSVGFAQVQAEPLSGGIVVLYQALRPR